MWIKFLLQLHKKCANATHEKARIHDPGSIGFIFTLLEVC